MRASNSENVAGRQRLPAPQLLVPTSRPPPSPGVSAQPVLGHGPVAASQGRPGPRWPGETFVVTEPHSHLPPLLPWKPNRHIFKGSSHRDPEGQTCTRPLGHARWGLGTHRLSSGAFIS